MKLNRRDFLKATSAVAATGALTACSSSSSSDDGAGSDSGETPDWVRDASEVTGTVTVYTTLLQDPMDAIDALWAKYYPDSNIDWETDSVGTLVTKVRSDENSPCDVIAGGMFASDGTENADILQEYVTMAEENGELEFLDDTHLKSYLDVQEMCLCVNPDLEAELGVEITGYASLINDALDGQIIVAEPDSSSSGFRQLHTMLAVMGDEFGDDKAWGYIESLIPLCFSTNSSKDVFNLTAEGEYVVGLSYESGVLEQIGMGANLELVYPEEGNTAMPSGGSICKNSPNLTAAQAFMDLFLSKEFGDIWETECSGRPNNTLSTREGLADVVNVDLDIEYVTEHKQEMIERYNDLVATLS